METLRATPESLYNAKPAPGDAWKYLNVECGISANCSVFAVLSEL
jgi:hypothetical protein